MFEASISLGGGRPEPISSFGNVGEPAAGNDWARSLDGTADCVSGARERPGVAWSATPVSSVGVNTRPAYSAAHAPVALAARMDAVRSSRPKPCPSACKPACVHCRCCLCLFVLTLDIKNPRREAERAHAARAECGMERDS
ncbi:hypothetical protein D3C81_966480 [compost metagenome]